MALPAGFLDELRARTPIAAVAETATMSHPHSAAEAQALVDLSRTEEMPIVREVPAIAAPIEAIEARVGGEEDGDSDVFMVRRSSPELPALTPEAIAELAAAAAAAAEGVTLFVYGWENVQPGPLSWAFPSLRAALLAVRTMRNAVEWCIVAGREGSIESARAKGAILIEQNA